MHHSNREDPSNHDCVYTIVVRQDIFLTPQFIGPSEKRQAENLPPLHHQSFHFTNDAAAQLATRSMEPCHTRPNDIVRTQQPSINLSWTTAQRVQPGLKIIVTIKYLGTRGFTEADIFRPLAKTAPICKGLRAYANQLCRLFTRKRNRAYGFNSTCHAVCSTHKDPQTLRSHPPVKD